MMNTISFIPEIAALVNQRHSSAGQEYTSHHVTGSRHIHQDENGHFGYEIAVHYASLPSHHTLFAAIPPRPHSLSAYVIVITYATPITSEEVKDLNEGIAQYLTSDLEHAIEYDVPRSVSVEPLEQSARSVTFFISVPFEWNSRSRQACLRIPDHPPQLSAKMVAQADNATAQYKQQYFERKIRIKFLERRVEALKSAMKPDRPTIEQVQQFFNIDSKVDRSLGLLSLCLQFAYDNKENTYPSLGQWFTQFKDRILNQDRFVYSRPMPELNINPEYSSESIIATVYGHAMDWLCNYRDAQLAVKYWHSLGYLNKATHVLSEPLSTMIEAGRVYGVFTFRIPCQQLNQAMRPTQVIRMGEDCCGSYEFGGVEKDGYIMEVTLFIPNSYFKGTDMELWSRGMSSQHIPGLNTLPSLNDFYSRDSDINAQLQLIKSLQKLG